MPKPRASRAIPRRVLPVAASLLIVAFLAAALAPCPPRVPIPIAAVAQPMDCHEEPAKTFLTEPCPCGCEAHAPIAGGSVRLGVVLPSSAPDLAPRLAALLGIPAAPNCEGSFACPIDHVPLPA